MIARLPDPPAFPKRVTVKHLKSFSPTTQSRVQLDFLQGAKIVSCFQVENEGQEPRMGGWGRQWRRGTSWVLRSRETLIGRGAKNKTLTGFVTLNNCLLSGPSSVALCQQLLFRPYSWGPRRLCVSPGTQGSLGKIRRKEREEETRESSPVLVPSLTSHLFLCRLCGQASAPVPGMWLLCIGLAA